MQSYNNMKVSNHSVNTDNTMRSTKVNLKKEAKLEKVAVKTIITYGKIVA
jgi:hypothetical protein